MQSIFLDKNRKPTAADLEKGLANTFGLWQDLEAFTTTAYPNADCGWHYSSEKHGWHYRIKDTKRVLVYLLPRDGFFKAAFVFGDKALLHIYASDIAEAIKTEFRNAKKYAEGTGIRIDVKDASVLGDLKKLVIFKIAN